MTMMVTGVSDALIETEASEAKSSRAAGSLVDFEDRFDGLERRIDGVEQCLAAEIDPVQARPNPKIDTATIHFRTDVAVLKWMVGSNTAALMAILSKLSPH